MRSFFADESFPLLVCVLTTINKNVGEINVVYYEDLNIGLPGGLLVLATTATTSTTGSIPTL